MNFKIFRWTNHLYLTAFVVVLALVGVIRAQENTGQQQQGIITGPPVSTLMQEELGLLTLTGATSCSASLLTNEWIITAGHCIKASDFSNPSQVTLTANWNTKQDRTAAEIRSLRALPGIGASLPDIALIRVRNPFVVRGSTKHFRQQILANKMDDLMGYPIETFGRGRNTLARNAGSMAIQSTSDGQYRVAKTQISKVEGILYWFPRNSSNQIVSGGDSGGPSFVITRTGRQLVGVHSLCLTKCLAGQLCPRDDWTWISEIPECADAPIATVYDQVNQIIKDSVASLAKDPVTTVGNAGSTRVEGIASTTDRVEGTFNTSAPPPSVVSYIYDLRSDGNLEWRRHDGAEQGTPQWQSATTIGNGWSNFKHVFTGGKNTIYAVNDQGDLLWYRHNTAYDMARRRRRELDLTGPRVIGKGWQNFRHVFSAGNGIIYGIDQRGDLLWYRHLQYTDAVEMPLGAGSGMVGAAQRMNWAKSWQDLNGKVVGYGWGDFKAVFSGGDGIIYTVTNDGKLLRYRHVGYLDGRPLESAGAWEGPIDINTGWSDYRQFFSRGDGIIYAVASNGELFWFKEKVPRLGGRTFLGKRWTGPRKVDDGWSDMLKVFALLPGPPDVVR